MIWWERAGCAFRKERKRRMESCYSRVFYENNDDEAHGAREVDLGAVSVREARNVFVS